MARAIEIYGETLATVKGNSGTGIATLQELGLSVDQIRITPRLKHKDMNVDDFGPDVPADIIANILDATIRMTLVHFDDYILETLIAHSAGGNIDSDRVSRPGVLHAGAGAILGGFNALYSNACWFFSLGLTQTATANNRPVPKPWRFPACYLTTQPLVIPIGTTRSLVELQLRAIPYVVPPNETIVSKWASDLAGKNLGGPVTTPGELVSAGAVVWDNVVLT